MNARKLMERRAARLAAAGCYKRAWQALLAAAMIAEQPQQPAGKRLHAHHSEPQS